MDLQKEKNTDITSQKLLSLVCNSLNIKDRG